MRALNSSPNLSYYDMNIGFKNRIEYYYLKLILSQKNDLYAFPGIYKKGTGCVKHPEA